jgi:putative transposase
MGRKLRAFTEGTFHFSSHASDKRDLFLNDGDREDFLDRVAHVCERFLLAVVSYVLMGNHYHVVLRVPDARVSEALQRLHTDYSREHNRRHGRKAHLFRAHAMAREIVSNEDLVGTCRYLARNPVEANFVDDPLAWRWGSARAHAGLEAARIPLDETDLRAALGGSASWRWRYTETLFSGVPELPPIYTRIPDELTESKEGEGGPESEDPARDRSRVAACSRLWR